MLKLSKKGKQMIRVKVDLVHSPDGDWVGLYFEGKLMTQGHSIQEFDVMKIVAQYSQEYMCWFEAPVSHWNWDPDEDGGHLPDEFAEISWSQDDE